MNKHDITALYYCIDEFCKVYEEWEKHKLIPKVGSRNREGKLRLSEMMCIEIMFHLSGFKNFKLFYEYGVKGKYAEYFKDLPCYERFVQIKKKMFLALSVLLQSLSGKKTGIYIADSTSLKVCHNLRINNHRVFKGLAEGAKAAWNGSTVLSYM